MKFLNFLIEICEKYGWKWQINKEKRKRKVFNTSCLSLFVGDIHKVRTLIVTGYDTPKMVYTSLFKYKPFNSVSNHQDEMLNSMMANIVSVAVMALSILLLFGNFRFSAEHIWRIVVFVIIALIGISVIIGIPNFKNYNRNNAAIILMLDMICTTKPRDDVGFVFLDKQAEDSLGYDILGTLIKNMNSYCDVIVLDAVGYGEDLYFAQTKSDSHVIHLEDYDDLKEIRLTKEQMGLNALSFFRNAILITCGTEVDGDILVSRVRTNRDTIIDLDRLVQLKSILVDAIDKL